MKECPKCHTKYDDIMNFCQKDGCQLQNVSSSPLSINPSSPAGTPLQVNSKPRRTHSFFKAILIIVAIISAAGLCWYFSRPVYTIYPEMSKYEVKVEGESFIMPVHTDAPYSKWEATCSESWVDITKMAEGIRIICVANIDKERIATIYLTCEDRKKTNETIQITQAGCYGIADGHEFVDLGLSVNWASCNVGANRPEDYGDYYAWGETRIKSEYTRENSEIFGQSMSDISGRSSYDVASYSWGGKWRMPTKAEFEELKDNTTTKRTERNGVKGHLVTSDRNGASIFLPAAGYRYGTSLFEAGENVRYWSSTPVEADCFYAYYLNFYSGFFARYNYWYRYGGQSVRPVRDK